MALRFWRRFSAANKKFLFYVSLEKEKEATDGQAKCVRSLASAFSFRTQRTCPTPFRIFDEKVVAKQVVIG